MSREAQATHGACAAVSSNMPASHTVGRIYATELTLVVAWTKVHERQSA
jgi:hypothetical protein